MKSRNYFLQRLIDHFGNEHNAQLNDEISNQVYTAVTEQVEQNVGDECIEYEYEPFSSKVGPVLMNLDEACKGKNQKRYSYT